jgi:flagellar motor switch protein FliN/FliY
MDEPSWEPLADVPLRLEIELDRKTMTVGEILSLEEGGVLRLGRSAGENVSLRVSGAPVASGEIVILEDNMGVRITDFHEKE